MVATRHANQRCRHDVLRQRLPRCSPTTAAATFIRQPTFNDHVATLHAAAANATPTRPRRQYSARCVTFILFTLMVWQTLLFYAEDVPITPTVEYRYVTAHIVMHTARHALEAPRPPYARARRDGAACCLRCGRYNGGAARKGRLSQTAAPCPRHVRCRSPPAA